ncbi:DUF3141 domain-containing protein [Thauera aromatica]|jgi:hypothetical protein|uniref:DUF3141 protein n=1 Tax=Thauera aromatica K172 TaxID=44139 RepID=A0A2R4BJW6_THAAR|nr:DUF3141 domain-containing protein [Thauera aromatica]AVR87615.1 DUF3141 protein [Thauera aromatica K172]
MSRDTTTSPTADWGQLLWDPLRLSAMATEYAVDAWQRSILYADVRRQRGNQYQAHLEEQTPNVLDFVSEVIMSGLDLPRPVNYGLVRILPPADTPSDSRKRPFVVVDPRAGHGPGIGGFKPDSEVGAALKAGHPCYFVGFLPDPVPGQTVEDVMRAEAAFVRKVGELHPDSRGKPAVIGNCQAGWQILMAAAVWPELFGPIIVAGAPLSYWAGDMPMRYAGGLTGGSWLTALTSDLGAGRFDGAWLVQNFENLDPANTLWTKQYNLYAKVDTEGPRHLQFEKYWGGHVFLNDVEMQYIVDNLFIGNKLSTAQLVTSDGVRIDLRNIRSPIVVFCSYGDNITPPPQALGWITDLYRNDLDVVGHDQTIVYATHDSIGHLGIFVSGSVGRKEHQEFAANIDIIDVLPAGIHHMQIDEHHDDAQEGEPASDAYLTRIRRSNIDEIREIVRPDPESDRRFAAAARISEVNLACYRSFVQPWVRALVTDQGAKWLEPLHPLRMGYELWSDRHPLAAAVQEAAQQVREHRQTVSEANPFLQLQTEFSTAVEQMLDQFRDCRDQIYAQAFDMLYSLPLVQAMTGQSLHDDAPPRPHPSETPEHRQYLAQELTRLEADIHNGGITEAAIRALFFVLAARGEADGRHFRHAEELVRPHLTNDFDMQAFRHLVRRQALLMRLDEDAMVSAIPGLLNGIAPEDIRQVAGMIVQVIGSGDVLSAHEQTRLEQVSTLFKRAACEAQAASALAMASPANETSAAAVDGNSAPAMPSSAGDTSAAVMDTKPQTSSPKPKAPQKKTVSKTPVALRTSQTRRGKGK